MLGNYVRYDAQACWHDVYHALMGAENLICITGWAVWDKLQLFRGSDLNIDNRYGEYRIKTKFIFNDFASGLWERF